METTPHVTQQRLAARPSMPQQSINDDDLYVIDVRTRAVITSYGASSETARVARIAGIQVKPGQALLKGMQLRSMGAVQ
ncbi:hypothetical protein RCH27_08365 [Paracidovorax citrulli]|uniref:hypothetical protein n=1 Tax=Paracidovorax citrulli TaxID=80869 RepID=UPI003A80FF27